MVPKIRYNKRNKLSLFIGEEELSPIESVKIEQSFGADDLIVVTAVFISEKGTDLDLLDQLNIPVKKS